MTRENHFRPSAKAAATAEPGQADHRNKGATPARRSTRRGAAWRRLWGEEEGQTLVEYGLLIGLLALVVIAAVSFFGRRMSNNLYGTSANGLPFNY